MNLGGVFVVRVKRCQNVFCWAGYLPHSAKARFDVNYAPACNPKHWFKKKGEALSRFVKGPTEQTDEIFDKYFKSKEGGR